MCLIPSMMLVNDCGSNLGNVPSEIMLKASSIVGTSWCSMQWNTTSNGNIPWDRIASKTPMLRSPSSSSIIHCQPNWRTNCVPQRAPSGIARSFQLSTRRNMDFFVGRATKSLIALMIRAGLSSIPQPTIAAPSRAAPGSNAYTSPGKPISFMGLFCSN